MMQKYIYKIHKLINQTLSPQFLQKLDRYLLLNYPRLWAIKIHSVCYYVLLINTLIICFVIGYPIKLYQFKDLITIGFIIVIMIELILFSYWWGLQSLYNVEKQYGNYYKKDTHIFLEILCYSACIILIFSASIVVFDLSTTLKASFIIPQTKLSTDILIMDLIDADRFRGEEINNLTDIDAYFYKLETYVERKEKEAQQQKKQNDCPKKYD